MTPDDNKQLVRQWVAAINTHDMDAFDKLFAPDTYDHVGRRPGVAWWREVYARLYESFPDLNAEIQALVAEQDLVIVRLVFRGTHERSAFPMLDGIAARGRTFEWTHHHTFRCTQHGLAEHWANRDDLGLLRQLRD